MALYPWQIHSWQTLLAQREVLPHALLLTGEEGIGKRQFAEHMAQYLLCEAEDDASAPCGQCTACGWFAANHHPDYRVLGIDTDIPNDEIDTPASKKPGQWITVEAVRALNEFIYTRAHRGGMRVVLIYPAEAINVAGANALLKMLEEPPEHVMFILVSHRWQRLLATINSRCRRFALPMPDRSQALAWLDAQQVAHASIRLSHCGGAPLRAHAHAGQIALLDNLLPHLAEPKKLNVVALAAEIEQHKAQTADIVDCLQKWVVDHLLYQQTGNVRYYPDYQAAFVLPGRLGAKLWRFYDLLLHARRYASHPLNQRLLLEQLFYSWVDTLKEAYSNQANTADSV